MRIIPDRVKKTIYDSTEHLFPIVIAHEKSVAEGCANLREGFMYTDNQCWYQTNRTIYTFVRFGVNSYLKAVWWLRVRVAKTLDWIYNH